jgi:1-acyl-sn-glycerol-3-phosphate acyltransferase
MKRTLVTIYLWVFIFFNFVTILFLVFFTSLFTFPFDKTRLVATKIMLEMGSWIVKVWPGWKVKIFGKADYDGKEARVFISNHQSFLDMPLQALLPYHFKWVSKAELFSVPIMGWFMSLTGQLSVIRGKSSAEDLLQQAIPMLERGVSICIFPEGTRTRTKELLPFKKGAFVLAWEAGVKIQPLVIDGTFDLNQPDDWRFLDKGEIQMHILNPIDPKDFVSVDEMTSYTHQLYEEKLAEIRSKSFHEAVAVK